jgi:hypothetical protein
MTKPNGVEFRIFDHFPDIYIDNLVFFISLVAENSRITQTKGYVYQNKIWIRELHNIMKNGYKAKISSNYIKLLRDKLGLKINTTSIIAIDIFKTIYKELFDKNIDGEWSSVFNCLDNKKKIFKKSLEEDIINKIPDINKNGWQFSFALKLNSNKNLLKKFNLVTMFLNKNKEINYKDFKDKVLKIFGNKWKNDVEDIAYFYESLSDILIYFKNSYFKLLKDNYGSIKKIIIKNNIPMFKNFNEFIYNTFSLNNSYFNKNILNKLNEN